VLGTPGIGRQPQYTAVVFQAARNEGSSGKQPVQRHIRQAGLIVKISAADIRMHAGKPDQLE